MKAITRAVSWLDLGQTMDIEIRYRLDPSKSNIIPPQNIKLEVPGWSGEKNNHPQPWNCLPWIEGTTYGIELIYSQSECHVTKNNGKIEFSIKGEACPFGVFAKGHYGYTSGVDLMGPEEHSLRLEPHPRYFVDETETVPCCVPGHIQTEFWQRIFFVVFKAPREGQTHIFRPGEPYAQVLFVPKKANYKITKMSAEESASRNKRDADIHFYDQYISNKMWTAENGNSFSDKYKVLYKAFNSGGNEAVIKEFNKAYAKKQSFVKSKSKIKRILVKRKNNDT